MFYLIGLGGVLGYAALQYGAVDRDDWLYCSIILGLLAIVYYAVTRRRELAPKIEPWIYWPLVLLPCYIALQLIPLPAGLLRMVSPQRAEHLRALGAAGFASLSVVPSVTLAHLLRVLGYAATFLIVREITWRRTTRTWTLVLPIIIVAVFEAAYGLLLFFQGIEPQDSAHGTYMNRNHFAGLLEMALPPAIMGAVAIWRKTRSTISTLPVCAMLAASALVLVGIIYSFSRMGFVACILSLFLTGVLALRNRVSKKWLAGGLVLCLALLAFIYLPPDQLIERFGKLWDGDELTTEGRLYIWEEALPLLKSYALSGCGLGGFESVFSQYQRSVTDRKVDFAHNDYLQYLVELGAIGFLIAAILIGCIFVRGWRERNMDEESEEHALAIGCIASLAAILIHSFVDFNLYVPANAMTMAWILGITAGLGFHSSKEQARINKHQWIDIKPI